MSNIRPTQCGIHDCQVLKYQPSVTSGLIFQYSMIINGIKIWNIALDVTNGWYFRTWQSCMPPSMLVALSTMPVALSDWVGLLTSNTIRPIFKSLVLHYSRFKKLLIESGVFMNNSSRHIELEWKRLNLQFQAAHYSVLTLKEGLCVIEPKSR